MSELIDMKFYKKLIDESAGYALHRIVVDQEGLPIDFIYIDVNEAFEEYTGLKREKILNKRATEVLPGIQQDRFDWIGFYGNVALNGGTEELEQFYEPFNRYYHIKVFSPKKDYFITLFTDETIQMRLSGFSKYLLEDKEDKIDYQRITDEMLEISGAKYVVFNLFESCSKDFTTMAVSGVSEQISTAGRLLGFEIAGRKWKHDRVKEEMTRDRIITIFNSVFELSRDIVPKKTLSLIDRAFSLGQAIVVRIKDEDVTLGDFTLIMPKDVKLTRIALLELFASQVGLFLRRKESESYVRVGHRRMKLAMDASENGYWEWNLDTGEVYMSSVFQRMLGYEIGELEPRVEALVDLMHQHDRQTVLPSIMKYIENAEQYEEEFRFRCKDGSWKWISGRGKSYDVDDSGRPNRVFGMNVDISKIKQAHERLELSEQNYRRMFETMIDMIFVSDFNGRIIYANGSAARTLGYDYSELLDMNCRGIHHAGNEIEVKTLFNDIVEGNREYCPLPLVSQNGRKIPVETRTWKGEWNGEKCLFWISKDLSTEQEILQKYDRIFMRNPSLMAVRSISGNIFTEVNDAFVESTGYSRDEIVGRTAEELGLFIFESYADEVGRAQEGQRNKNKEVKVRGKDGEMLSCIYYDEVIESQGKRFLLTMMIDITELKRTKDEIKHMSNHDSLTGLYNRRFYETEIKRLDVARNLPISVVMIDVNGLKLVNDAFGHDKGDEMLIKVAEAIKSECRSDEIIARLGGDEFVVLLPKTKHLEAEVVSERLIKRVSKESVGLVNISISCGTGTKDREESFSETVKRADEAMYRKKLFESQDMKKGTISQIMKSLYDINSIEECHSKNVAETGKRLAEACGMTKEKADEIFELGLKHDIGKIALDNRILDKADKLEDREWIELKRHSEVGYQIMRSVNEYAQMANYVLAHHERWDGRGYPGGLKGVEIPLESRIITIADAYDAMTNDRPYRKALCREDIVAEFSKGAGTQFDPELVGIFLEHVMV